MKKILFSTAIATMCLMPQAKAADKMGGYAGVDVGYAYVKGDAQETANTLVSILGGSASVIQETSTIMGRVYGGYNINKNLALEVGYLRTGNLTTTVAGVAGNSVAYTGKADAHVSGVDYALLVKPFDSKNAEGIFAKVGGHYTETTVDLTLTGTSTATASASEKGSGFLVGVGYEAPLSDSVDYRVAYTYYNNISGLSDNNSSILTAGILAKF
jgi:OOP family OmpA-OmpF porin